MALKMKRDKNKKGVSRTMCPHCGYVCHAYKSEQVTELTRSLAFRCSNDDCGHAFNATLYITCTTNISMMPNNKIRLPISKHINKYIVAAQQAQQKFDSGEQTELDLNEQ